MPAEFSIKIITQHYTRYPHEKYYLARSITATPGGRRTKNADRQTDIFLVAFRVGRTQRPQLPGHAYTRSYTNGRA